jgi:REP element-mobilizing transposase RayT
MPRKARIDAPGALHHIISRGIERRDIFKDDFDRKQFLKRLSSILTETATPCYAWALLSNHFHLLLRTGLIPLSKVMSRLLTGYVKYFNRRHDRHGQLFQNRYKSFLCQEDAYLLELVRYIHLNPIRAREVENLYALERHPYSGHSALIGFRHLDWQDTGYVLGYFGSRKNNAIAEYTNFVGQCSLTDRRPDLVGGGLVRSNGGWTNIAELRRDDCRIKGDERILGDSDFVESILEQANERLEHKYRLKVSGRNIDDIADKVATVMNLPVDMVFERSRRPAVVKARSLFCYWAHEELGTPMKALAALLRLSQPAVSIAVRRGEKLALEYQED